MKIVGITACTAGIAHTYIAKEKIENAARKNGDEIKNRNTRFHWCRKRVDGKRHF